MLSQEVNIPGKRERERKRERRREREICQSTLVLSKNKFLLRGSLFQIINVLTMHQIYN